MPTNEELSARIEALERQVALWLENHMLRAANLNPDSFQVVGDGSHGYYGVPHDLLRDPATATPFYSVFLPLATDVAGSANIVAVDVLSSLSATFSAYAVAQGVFAAPASNTFLALTSADNSPTIAGGVITATGSWLTIETEGGAASDDLDTIACDTTTPGQLLFISPLQDDHTVVVKHGTGNIHLTGSVDFTMDSLRKGLMLIRRGFDSVAPANWYEWGRMNTT